MRQIRRSNNGIVDGVIWKGLLQFFFPIMLGTFFQQLYNTVDAAIIGNYDSPQALAAVGGSAAQILNLIVSFFVGLSSGATVIVSQFYGAREHKNVSRAVHTALALAIVGGAAMTLIGLISAPTLLKWMKTPLDTIEGSIIYLRIVFLSMIPQMIYNVGSGILRAVGDSRRPLYFLIICCGINIVLDILFVAILHWRVAGVAIATVTAQVISAILVLISLSKAQDSYRLEIRQIHADRDLLQETMRIGIPAGLQAAMYGVSNMIITSTINEFQSTTVAAWVVLGKVDALNWMILSAFGVSLMTFVGQNYGAHQYDRVRKGIRVCMTMAIATSFMFGALFLLSGQYVYRFFSDDPNTIEVALEMMWYIAPWYWIYVPIELISGSLRGMGDSIIPTAITAIGICVLRVAWMFVVVPRWWTLFTVILSYPISWVLTSAAFLIYYFIVRRRLLPTQTR